MGQKDHEHFKLFCSLCPIVSWPTLSLDFHLPCVELSAAGLMEVITFVKEGNVPWVKLKLQGHMNSGLNV